MINLSSVFSTKGIVVDVVSVVMVVNVILLPVKNDCKYLLKVKLNGFIGIELSVLFLFILRSSSIS